MSEAQVSYFCPGCGSAAVDVPLLHGAKAVCRACAWSGSTTELLAHTFQQDLGSPEAIYAAFIGDFKKLMGGHVAQPLAGLLYKWGFFKNAPTPKELTRYVVAMARASVTALWNEREQIAKEEAQRGS